MNLWDSVHRGLEKASHEAGRIARIQRLRSTIDRLSRQVGTQESAVLNRTMELFVAGKITQSELTPLCQELITLHQQLSQAHAELKHLQSQASPTSAPVPSPDSLANYPAQTPANPYVAPTEAYTLPDHQQTHGEGATPPPPPPPGADAPLIGSSGMYFTGNDTPPPPPPPGADLQAISAKETVLMSSSPGEGQQICTKCGVAALPDTVYCHNCGAPLQRQEVYEPTMRTSASGSYPISSSDQGTARTNPPDTKESNETIFSPPPAPDTQSPEKDGGK